MLDSNECTFLFLIVFNLCTALVMKGCHQCLGILLSFITKSCKLCLSSSCLEISGAFVLRHYLMLFLELIFLNFDVHTFVFLSRHFN